MNPALCPLRRAGATLLLALLGLAPLAASAQGLPASCGSLKNAYGPFDYRVSRDKLAIVEKFHLTPQVEMLVRGESGALGADLDYTLRASPNHHRALLAVMRYSEQPGPDPAKGAQFTFDCYFNRAVAFAPEDTTVRMIFATYLSRHKRREEALGHLAVARQLAEDNGFTHFNLGMVYADMGEFELALAQAHEAERLGFTRPELKDRLTAAGKWQNAASAPQ